MLNHPLDLVLLAVAGGIGTLLRAGCISLAIRICGDEPGWVAQSATLAVNVLGSFAFGSIVALAQTRLALPASQQTILLVGLLGGFTTYSSFAFQAVEMLDHGRVVAAATYVAATTTLALAAAWAGLRCWG